MMLALLQFCPIPMMFFYSSNVCAYFFCCCASRQTTNGQVGSIITLPYLAELGSISSVCNLLLKTHWKLFQFREFMTTKCPPTSGPLFQNQIFKLNVQCVRRRGHKVLMDHSISSDKAINNWLTSVIIRAHYYDRHHHCTKIRTGINKQSAIDHIHTFISKNTMAKGGIECIDPSSPCLLFLWLQSTIVFNILLPTRLWWWRVTLQDGSFVKEVHLCSFALPVQSNTSAFHAIEWHNVSKSICNYASFSICRMINSRPFAETIKETIFQN